MSQTQPLLCLEALSKSFGGIRATNEISMQVQKGSITAVIGPNGAGKTTLFNLIAGFYHPDDGAVLLDGHDITRKSPEQIAARGLIRTFQLVRPFRQMTVFENVLVGFHRRTRGELLAALLRPAWMQKQEHDIAVEAEDLLAFVGLNNECDLSVDALTYGQQRLLEIARALAARPALVMLDEPAAGLTPPETAALALLLRKIRSLGQTILLIEHDIELVMGIADAVVVLDFGRKIASGTSDTIKSDPAVVAAYLGPGLDHA